MKKKLVILGLLGSLVLPLSFTISCVGGGNNTNQNDQENRRSLTPEEQEEQEEQYRKESVARAKAEEEQRKQEVKEELERKKQQKIKDSKEWKDSEFPLSGYWFYNSHNRIKPGVIEALEKHYDNGKVWKSKEKDIIVFNSEWITDPKFKTPKTLSNYIDGWTSYYFEELPPGYSLYLTEYSNASWPIPNFANSFLIAESGQSFSFKGQLTANGNRDYKEYKKLGLIERDFKLSGQHGKGRTQLIVRGIYLLVSPEKGIFRSDFEFDDELKNFYNFSYWNDTSTEIEKKASDILDNRAEGKTDIVYAQHFRQKEVLIANGLEEPDNINPDIYYPLTKKGRDITDQDYYDGDEFLAKDPKERFPIFYS